MQPPIASIGSLIFRPKNMPKHSPISVNRNETNATTPIGYAMLNGTEDCMHAKEMPTARASILVATASVNITL